MMEKNEATSQSTINLLRAEFASDSELSEEAIELWIEVAEEAMYRQERMTISLLEKLLERRSKPLPPLLIVYQNYCLGTLSFIENDWEQYRSYFNIALEELAKLQAPQQTLSINNQYSELEATLLVNLARALSEIGQIEKAHEIIQEVLPFAETNHLPWIEDKALITLSSVALFEGKLDDALKYGRKALEVATGCNDNLNKFIALQFIGMSYRQQSKHDEAIEAYEEAVSVGQLIGQSARLGSVFNNLAAIYATLGKMKEALTTFQMALNMHKQRRNVTAAVITLGNIAEAHQLLGQYDEADQAYRQAWEMVEQLDSPGSKLITISKLTCFLAEFGNRDEALVYIGKTRDLLENPAVTEKVQTAYLIDTYSNFAQALLRVSTTEDEIWEVLRYQKQHKKICRKSGQLENITELNNLLVAIVSNGHKLAHSPPALIILYSSP
jgi:tetratricopeptide (TPR) repeat protein